KRNKIDNMRNKKQFKNLQSLILLPFAVLYFPMFYRFVNTSATQMSENPDTVKCQGFFIYVILFFNKFADLSLF
ncbi:MAG: hypothetical protein KA792_10905, partial [Bacteroidales bacterium]|nr:hypothetical protein [Bacteroidales bacterium]